MMNHPPSGYGPPSDPSPDPVYYRPDGDASQDDPPPGGSMAAPGFADGVGVPQEPFERPAAKRSRTGLAIRELAETLLLALFIYLAVRAVVQNFKVEGASMDPTLHHGQYLLVNKAAYMSVDLAPAVQAAPFLSDRAGETLYPFGLPNRGDIVVFRFPRDPSRDFIKRVVALPGETVEIRAGQVFVNGRRLEEPYILNNPTYSKEAIVVGPGKYYVLGDNRNNSSDSHVWGPVPIENIIGKAWLTYWPVEDWGPIPDHPVSAGR